MSIGIFLPVALTLAVTAAGTLAFGWWSAGDIDDAVLRQETALANHAIAAQFPRIVREQQGSTIWDEAVAKTRYGFDAGWIDANLGAWMSDFYGHDGIIILDAADRPVYVAAEGERADLDDATPRLRDIAPLVAHLRAAIAAGAFNAYASGSADIAPHETGVVRVDGVPSLVSISPIISDTGRLPQAPGTEYLHAAIVHLDADYAARLGQEYLVPEPAFTVQPTLMAERAAVPVLADDGRILTFFEWHRATPGHAMLIRTIPVLAVAFIIGAIFVFALIDQVWRKSRALEAGRADAEHRAAHDPLTGLPNRMSFEATLERALGQASGRDRRVSVLILDLDHFKRVNDTLGHRAGDDLIRAVGQRLRQVLDPADCLARLGGDEFGIVHSHAPGLAHPHALSERIITAIGMPFGVFGSEAFVGVSIGIAPAEAGDTDAQELARKADIALYEAKAAGRNRAVVFEESMNELLQNRKTIEVELREALRRNDQLSVAFQPLFSRDGIIVGAEALARWSHPRLGLVSPAHFIPVAEATGLISQLGMVVLEAACRMGARWPGRTIAANISPAQLRDREFPRQVFDLLARTGMRAADLELEITEGILLEEASDPAEALRVFRAAGIRIALDDFGTGYSSLNYLKRYPVDRIKIDRSFVSQLSPGGVSLAIVQAMVTLAHALAIEVTAEGVETSEQMTLLAGLGCNVLQGFLLSAPLPPAELEPLFSQRPAARVA
jgi:diguanylate cyclase (GGDEF)-like protein